MQQAEVAELNRRAQHAEQESSAARAEAAAVRQAAAQQQAERAIAQYSHANRMAGLPFQDPLGAREYEPLPGLGSSRYGLLCLARVYVPLKKAFSRLHHQQTWRGVHPDTNCMNPIVFMLQGAMSNGV